ncbi:hypothetical protein KO481_36720 [Nocardia sp. NEAU-G5]|jgi:hypothetical protein|uniref:Trm112 family protein n=1 Tax=Nocardia albiluteola TaxID=2842303 RepID=A0ABS6B9S8_9NOCA|nr:hypothetical protein [Nocardia albiluteola]MBU3067052.1 hypothetical protein [Nocardia albiluteola]
MQTPKSGPITLIACPRDRLIISDPAVRYRPEQIPGRHYLVTPVSPSEQPEPTE